MTATYEDSRPVPGYPPYRVTREGVMFGRKGQRMRPMRASSGHRYIISGRRPSRKLFVHRAVLLAFVGFPAEGQECRHLDGNPENNRLSNLKWGTRFENAADCKRHGRRLCGFDSLTAKLVPADIPSIMQLRGVLSSRKVAAMFGVSHTTIQRVWRGGYYVEAL